MRRSVSLIKDRTLIYVSPSSILSLPRWLHGKASAYSAGDIGSITGLEGFPGEGSGNPLHYSCLRDAMDREAWRATAHGVTKSRTQLRD